MNKDVKVEADMKLENLSHLSDSRDYDNCQAFGTAP